MNEADELLEQWQLANEMLDQLEGKPKDELFDFMMSLAIELANSGYSIDSNWQWQKISHEELLSHERQ